MWISYNASSSACEKGLQWIKVVGLLRQMQRWNMKVVVIMYGAPISACEKGLQCITAVSLLQEMEQGNLDANVITYNAIISACEKATAVNHRREPAAGDGAVEHDGAWYHVQRNHQCEKGQQWSTAVSLLREMEQSNLEANVITCNATMSA